MLRYSAKLLFIWDPDPVTGSRRRRLCEERIVVFRSRSARAAVRKATAIGKTEEIRFDSGHRLRFAGILQCMELDDDPNEVWWEFKRRAKPEEWARKSSPPMSALYVFTDGHPKASKPLQPTSRAKRKAKTKGRPSAARG